MNEITKIELRGIPQGPLTKQDHENLANSFYDGSRLEAQRIAKERGIRSGERVGLAVREMLDNAQAARDIEEHPLDK